VPSTDSLRGHGELRRGRTAVADWAIARIEEIEEVDDGRCPFRPVRQHFGIRTFGATTWTAAAAGDRLINEHDENEEFDGGELYLVLSGEARFELDGESVAAPTGTFVNVPPSVVRTAFAERAGTTVLAVGAGREGQVYRPGGWELWSPARLLFEQGRHEEVVERLRPIAERDPHYPLIFYNLACAESLLGRVDDALADLGRAIELEPSFAEYARGDEDLAAIRETPRFAEVAAA
jgi:tetratricopeptide (TPR) repeat protein